MYKGNNKFKIGYIIFFMFIIIPAFIFSSEISYFWKAIVSTLYIYWLLLVADESGLI